MPYCFPFYVVLGLTSVRTLTHFRMRWSVAAVLLCWAAPAEAANTCTISATAISFGSYDVFSATALTGTGTITFACLQSKPITVSLSAGNSGSYGTRNLNNGSNTLQYNLYTTAGLTSVWGDGTGSTAVYSDSAPPKNNVNVNVTVFANVPAGQDVVAGTYTDSIIATINF